MLAGLASLVAVLLFGVRWDEAKKRRRAAALARLRLEQTEKSARDAAERAHKEIALEAEISRSNPTPTESDLDRERAKIEKLWKKLLRHRRRK
jgi:hypothetical protein